jgi:hypothetical protein
VDDAAVERALCDAQHIGSIDGAAPERAFQDVQPSVVRFVWRRDGGRCRVDGCRSARGIEVHHIVHRADGGTHEPLNLALLCSSCHAAHHRGALSITGTADRLVVRRQGQGAPRVGEASSPVERAAPADRGELSIMDRANHLVGHRGDRGAAPVGGAGEPVEGAVTVTSPRAPASPVGDGSAHVGARGSSALSARGAGGSSTGDAAVVVGTRAHVGVSKLEVAIIRTQAKEALVGLGWKTAVAGAAVTAAAAGLGSEVTLERLIFEALRRCPMPSA